MVATLGHVSELSIQKFSSNVIECFLKYAEAGVRSRMCIELCDQCVWWGGWSRVGMNKWRERREWWRGQERERETLQCVTT
jgi:hypothetical protein